MGLAEAGPVPPQQVSRNVFETISILRDTWTTISGPERGSFFAPTLRISHPNPAPTLRIHCGPRQHPGGDPARTGARTPGGPLFFVPHTANSLRIYARRPDRAAEPGRACPSALGRRRDRTARLRDTPGHRVSDGQGPIDASWGRERRSHGVPVGQCPVCRRGVRS
jgi:hypothetical protein